MLWRKIASALEGLTEAWPLELRYFFRDSPPAKDEEEKVNEQNYCEQDKGRHQVLPDAPRGGLGRRTQDKPLQGE